MKIFSTIESKADIDKKIEIETANLMYFDRIPKEHAFKQATEYIEKKYEDIIKQLKDKSEYN